MSNWREAITGRPVGLVVRLMEPRDHAVAAMADHWSFDEPFRWTATDYQVHSAYLSGGTGAVVERGGRTAGVLVYATHTFEIEVLRLVVKADYRRLGVGRLLLRLVAERLDPGRQRLAFVDCPESHTEAHLFLRSCGWTATGIRQTRAGAVYRFVTAHPECEGA